LKQNLVIRIDTDRVAHRIFVILSADDRMGMICRQLGFKYGERSVEKLCRLFVVSLFFVEHAEVVDRQCYVNVIAAEEFLL
jgi:hypothetical protein